MRLSTPFHFIVAVCEILFLVASQCKDPQRKSDLFDRDQTHRCASIMRVRNMGDRLDVTINVQTGGMYHTGCSENLEIAFIPPAGSVIDATSHGGARCMGNGGTTVRFKENGVSYNSTLHCMQVGKMTSSHGSRPLFIADPIVLGVDFDSPVYERELERQNIRHRGGPHPESVPFVSGAFRSNAGKVVSEEDTAMVPEVSNYDNTFRSAAPAHSIEDAKCTEFTFPDEMGHIPEKFSMLDTRVAVDIFILKRLYKITILVNLFS